MAVDVDLELVPASEPGTVRVPDLVVVTEASFQRVRDGGGLLRAADVLLAVEILSRSTRRTDSVIKRAEYADAGIGHYWIVDLLDGPSLTACHLAGEFGYVDDPPVRGRFSPTDPFPARIDLDRLR
jgi:Uma2 family endonuclease